MANKYVFAHTNNLNNANLGFTSGLQSDLNALITSGGATEGTFYLTTDTHRLYIGRTVTSENGTSVSKTVPVPISEGIQTVDVVAVPEPNPQNKVGLPTSGIVPGEFYYVTDSNILCIYNGESWVQINPNTDTDTFVSSANISTGTPEYQLTSDSTLVAGKTYYSRSESSGSYVYNAIQVDNLDVANIATYYEPYRIKYTLTVNQTKRNEITGQNLPNNQQPSPIEANFYINSNDIANVLSVSAGLTRSAVSNNASTLSLDGGISNGHQVTIKGGTNVTVATNDDDNTITLSTPNYEIAKGTPSNNNNNTVPIVFRTSNNATSSVNITAGDHLEIDSTDSTGITIKHSSAGPTTKTNNTEDQYGESSASTKNLYGTGNSAATISVPTIKKDALGHITSIDSTTVTLNGFKAISADSSGKIIVTANNNDTALESGAVLYHTLTVDGVQNNVNNQGYLGSFYSAAGVDARIERALQSANAMVYRGTVGKQDSTVLTLPTTSVQIGDTYLVDNVSSVYTKTSDVTVDNTKDYYTESGGSFTKVNSPINNNIATYYEMVISNGVEKGDLLIATGDEYKQTTDTVINATKTYYTRTGSNYPYTYTKVSSPEVANINTYYENAGTIQNNLEWTYVPSGDDIDTQYIISKPENKTLGLRVNTTGHLNYGQDVSTIQFISGKKITPDNISELSTGNYQVRFDHDTSTVSVGSYGSAAESVTSASFGIGNTFKVPNITVDDCGHITAASTSEYTLPTPDTYTLINNTSKDGSGPYGTTIKLFKGNDGNGGTVTLIGDSNNGVSVAASSTTNGTIEIKHSILNPSADSSLTNFIATTGAVDISPDSNDKIVALTALELDSYGHIGHYKTSYIQLPKYTLSAIDAANNTATIRLQKNNNAVATTINFTSDNLTITTPKDNNDHYINGTYTINLEWGSFSANPTT